VEWLTGFATLLILGLIAGAIAKFLMPGKDPGGIIVTCILGVLGSLLGGWIANLLEIGGLRGFDWRSLVAAVGGSLLLLLAYRAFKMLTGASGASYASGRSTTASHLLDPGVRDEGRHPTTNLAEIAKEAMTPELLRTLSEKTGESPSLTRKAMEAMIPTVLAGLSSQALKSSGTSRLFDLVKGAASSGLARQLADGDIEAVGRQGQGFLEMIFGDKLAGLISWLARFVGIKESSASALTTAASGLIMSTLGKTIQQQGLDASGLGSLLSGQAGWLSKILPSGIGEVPGMKTLADLGSKATDAGRATAEAGRRVGATAKGAYRDTVAVADRAASPLMSALLPLALLLVPLLLFAWMMRGAAKVAEQTAGVARPPVIQPRVAGAPEVRTPENPLTPTTFNVSDIRLPNGLSLRLPEASFLNQVYKYLSDATAPRDRSFVFDGLDFDKDTIRMQPETEMAITNLSSMLKAFPSVALRIEGHSDQSADPSADRESSLARAEALKQLLVQAGVPSDRIRTAGLGSEKPVATNDTADGRAKNRRIELSFTKST
jgi:outer membrane protein OmpA-like peptidoglycan-associated protein/uncharacterized membrane protein YeaQ/YmgE (transglycosylase-associated protein family)